MTPETIAPSKNALKAVSSWIKERIEDAAENGGQWTQELEDWGMCLHRKEQEEHQRHDMKHFVEPPPPVGTGFVAMVASDYKTKDISNAKDVGDIVHFICGIQTEVPKCPCVSRPEKKPLQHVQNKVVALEKSHPSSMRQDR